MTNDNYCTRKWTTNYNGTGVKGFVVTSNEDPTKSIFFPAAGVKWDGGYQEQEKGVQGYYWTSTQKKVDSAMAVKFRLDAEKGEMFYLTEQGSWYYMSIRPVRDAPTPLIDEVKSVSPWDSTKGTVTVDYSLTKLDTRKMYKVAFDITANGMTRGVTNDAANLVVGHQTSKTIDTTALFGSETIDDAAEVKISLIEIRSPAEPDDCTTTKATFRLGPPPEVAESGVVQLWKDGPYFAACNLGAEKPEEYGWHFWWGDTVGYKRVGSNWVSVLDDTTVITFDNAPANSTQDKEISWLKENGWIDESGNLVSTHDAASEKLGAAWRMPTQAELETLVNAAYCKSEWTDNYKNTGVAGRIVTGVTEGYTDKSIFLPAAGRGYQGNFGGAGSEGVYWSSTPDSGSNVLAWHIYIKSDEFKTAHNFYRSDGFTVRPVCDIPPGSEENPWVVGENATAYVKDGTLYIKGTGPVTSMPWTEEADGITKLVKDEGVTELNEIVETLPDLKNVNGLALTELNGLAVAALKAAGFSAIAVDPATQEATLSVVICKAESLDEPEWKPVSTNDVPVKADTPAGFFIVAPAAPSDLKEPPTTIDVQH